MPKLNELLVSGLGRWIQDYQIAKNEGYFEMADIILQGIDIHTKNLSESEMVKVEKMIQGLEDVPVNEGLILEQEMVESLILEHTDLSDCQNASEIDNAINEGVISKLVGGAAGFSIGPALGKIIAKALGVKKRSVFYDFLTSRITGSALGAAFSKKFG